MQLSWAQGLVFALEWFCTQIRDSIVFFRLLVFTMFYETVTGAYYYWMPSTELKIVATKMWSLGLKFLVFLRGEEMHTPLLME